MFVCGFHEFGVGNIVIGEYTYFIMPGFSLLLGIGEMYRVNVLFMV